MNYILTFKNTNLVIKAEQCLKKCNISNTVLPLPSQLKAGCGLCLKVVSCDIKYALKTLVNEKIDELALFSFDEKEQKPSFVEISDWCILLE